MEVCKDGDSVSLCGEVSGKQNEEKVPSLANLFQSNGKKLCTLSTVFLDDPCKKELELLVDDESEESQLQFKKLMEIRPEVQNKYSEIMDFVDRTDQYILSNCRLICKHCEIHNVLNVWRFFFKLHKKHMKAVSKLVNFTLIFEPLG